MKIKFFDTDDVCTHLGIVRETLWYWRKRGKAIPFKKVGNELFYRLRDLKGLKKSNRGRPKKRGLLTEGLKQRRGYVITKYKHTRF